MPLLPEDEDDDRWTLEQEQMLVSWAEKSAGLRWLHMESQKHYKTINDILSLPVIVITTVAGVSSFVSNACNPVWNIVFAVVNLSGTVLVAAQRYLDPSTNAGAHEQLAADHSKLYRKIALTLSLPPRRRGSCIDFVTACRTEYDRIVSGSITIPSSQIKRFKAKFKSVTHSPEVVTGGIGTVSTHGEIREVQAEPHAPRRPRRGSVILQDVLINPVGNVPLHGSHAPPPLTSRPRLPLDVRRPSAEDVVSRGETFVPPEEYQLGRAPTMQLAPSGMGQGDEEYEPGGEENV